MKAIDELASGELENFLIKHGRRGNNLIESLARSSQFVEVVQTQVGEELLREIIIQIQKLTDKIVDEREDDGDRAELRVLKRLLDRWTMKIYKYLVAQGAIKKAL